MMNNIKIKQVLQSYRKNLSLNESTSYKSDDGKLVAKIFQYDGKHKVRFFKDGEHMKFSDYDGSDENDAHEFAQEEVAHHDKNHQE